MLETAFKQTSLLFESSRYEDGLQAIQQILGNYPRNANMFLNRAILFSQMEDLDRALADIQQSLQLNPRNYLAYFNRFSLQYRKEDDEAALGSLVCALSCMHLLKAKNGKDIQSAEKAIRYCSNNLEAHVLKGLLFLQQKEYIKAYFSFQQASLMEPQNQILFNLRSCAFQQAYPGQTEVKGFTILEQHHQVQKQLRSNYVRQQGLDHQIAVKLKQFNEMYLAVNDIIEAVTKKLTEHHSKIHHRPSTQMTSSQASCLQIEDPGLATPPQSSARPEPGQIYMRQSRLYSGSKLDDKFSEFKSILSSSPLHEAKDGHEQFQEFQSVLDMKKEDLDQFQDKYMGLQSNIELPLTEEEIPYQQTQGHYNLIYPIDGCIVLKTTVKELHLEQMDQENWKELKDVYCIVSYGQQKFTTTPKQCITGQCTWDSAQLLEIPTEPSDMKIKVYNKRYNSVRDLFLGDIEVLITTADTLKLPLFSKRGEALGTLTVELQLQEKQTVKQIKQQTPDFE